MKIFIALLLVLAAPLTAQNGSVPSAPLVAWSGPIEHLFFHPLIAFNDVAFGKKDVEFIDSWFVTVSEFKKILDGLYANNYVLVDFYDCMDPQTLKPKTLMLPAGKKPFILSVDDVNYYPVHTENGTIHKLIVGKDGQIATWSLHKGQEVTSKDNEVFPILETFIAAHPDFSINHARGIIALTGFYGFFGYRCDKQSLPDFKEQVASAKAVAERLKADGWRFASHSWAHRHPFKIDDETFFDFESRWVAEAERVTGPTDLYIYPFGDPLDKYKARLKFLNGKGFKFFFAVGASREWRTNEFGVHMDRINIDGMGMRHDSPILKPFFNAKEVLDPERPKR